MHYRTVKAIQESRYGIADNMYKDRDVLPPKWAWFRSAKALLSKLGSAKSRLRWRKRLQPHS